MAQTVIGFFDQSSEAQTAVSELINRGISRDRVDLSSGRGGTGTVSDSRSSDSDRGSNPIGNFFRSLFGSDNDDSDRYSRVAERSNTIVTVHAQSREEAEAAADILDRCGAIDVDERSREYGFTDTRSSGTGDRQDISSDRGTKIPRVEESLEVGKRTVETGGVRVRSRIVEKPVEEHVRLREEQVHVERQPVDRPVADHEREQQFRERDIELTERSEVPVVNKEARVVEEVRISKEVNERNETVRDTVRRTDIDIENNTDRDRQNTSTGSTGLGSTGIGSSDLNRTDTYGTEGRSDLDDRTDRDRTGYSGPGL